MKKIFIFLCAAAVITGCNEKKKGENSKGTGKNNSDTTYTITSYGIGPVKIGMTQAELEKVFNQALVLKHAKDTEEVWSDTAIIKYKDAELSLFFQKQYNEDESLRIMELYGLSSSSPLCKTAAGIGVGDDKITVVSTYDENYINMGPEYEQVNDSTWLPSKTKYNMHVSDTGGDKEFFFNILNKKIVAVGVSIAMGE